MDEASNPAEFVGYQPDERLLGEDLDKLPAAAGRPPLVPRGHARGGIVGAGATLTAASLVIGVLLVLLGVVDAISSGIDAAPIVAIVLGALLISTHWGWVHVAELTANSLEGRSHADVIERRQQWLASIEPYTRFEVSTEVQDDGSIAICSLRHRPVQSGEERFTFVREIEQRELHPPDEPAASVTERAEALRRQAALATEREHERYEVAADAYRTALLGREDEEQRRLAQRAASEALSRQINSNLRDPPLVE
ncbi:MAG TPA: hypothetical protein VMA77_20515 [Solirubrobacteraceae bacterium]|nr:hypothetical protein [Solirubrobacteraceae bacterium]HUA47632.1 hypothetical protein [Solirubrobacteraceae bacterium]